MKRFLILDIGTVKGFGINEVNVKGRLGIANKLVEYRQQAPQFNRVTESVSETEPKFINRGWVQQWKAFKVPVVTAQKNLLNKLKEKFNSVTRPRVSLTLQDGTVIEIDGGRDDKDNFKEESERLLRVGSNSSVLRDADNIDHQVTQLDFFNAYAAVVDNFSTLIQWKWAKEAEINRPDITIAELEAVVI